MEISAPPAARCLCVGRGGHLQPPGRGPGRRRPGLFPDPDPVPPAHVRQLLHRPAAPQPGGRLFRPGLHPPPGEPVPHSGLSGLCLRHSPEPVHPPAAGLPVHHRPVRLGGAAHPAPDHGRAVSGPPDQQPAPPGPQRVPFPAVSADYLPVHRGHLHRGVVLPPAGVPAAPGPAGSGPSGHTVPAVGLAALSAAVPAGAGPGAGRLPAGPPSPSAGAPAPCTSLPCSPPQPWWPALCCSPGSSGCRPGTPWSTAPWPP